MSDDSAQDRVRARQLRQEYDADHEMRFDCHECGRGVRVDEDGCCLSCGADGEIWTDGEPLPGQTVGPMDKIPRHILREVVAPLRAERDELRERCEALEGALKQQCADYCRWYDTGIPSMDGAGMAYHMVSMARAALRTEPDESEG